MRTIIFAALALTGCASSSPTYAPDGSAGYSLNCSGTARNWGMCYEKAGQLCKEKGYTVVAGGTDQSTTVVANQSGSQAHLYGSSSNTRSLVVTCNK